MAEKRALVTGATGFVGSNLVLRLVYDGWEVHALCRPSSSLAMLYKVKERLGLHQHDGTTEQMISIMDAIKPSIVFHLASLFIAEHRPNHVIPLINSNLLFGTQLVEAMACCKVKRLVNTGTSWQHFNDEEYNPVNLYAAIKQAFEDIIRYYVEAHDFKVITLKLFDTYGPDDPRPKLINLLKKIAETGEPLAMSPGEQLLDLVHIDDVVEAFVLAAECLLSKSGSGHECYAVSSGHPLPLRDIVELFKSVAGKELSIRWGERPYRKREVMIPWSKGKSLPGWYARCSAREGISAILACVGKQFAEEPPKRERSDL